MTDKRMDMYSELAEALGCDAMDSHAGRVEQATRARIAKDALREVANRLKLVMPCPGCSSHIAGADEHVLGCTVAQALDKARAVLEWRS
jgi:hypothetical protein